MSDPKSLRATVSGHSVWPGRIAWLTLFSMIGLFVLGGSVTTYRVGMAVPDWPQTFGYNMVLYPLDEMLQNFGVTLEHSHRLAGMWVGLCSILLVVVTCASDRRRSARALALTALVLVCLQGWLGGARVLENSRDLAFLHGSCAQIVFAVLGANVILHSRAWQSFEGAPCKQAPGLHLLTVIACGVLYAQIVIGAWLRHSGAHLPLFVHLVLAFAVVGVSVLCWRKVKQTVADGARGGHDRTRLGTEGRRFFLLVQAQFALGVGALVGVLVASGGFDRPVSKAEAWLATAHVVLGALLLLQSVSLTMWSRRVVLTQRQLAARITEATA